MYETCGTMVRRNNEEEEALFSRLANEGKWAQIRLFLNIVPRCKMAFCAQTERRRRVFVAAGGGGYSSAAPLAAERHCILSAC